MRKTLFIMNEEEFIKNVIEEKKKPEQLGMKRLVSLLCRYYYKLGIKPKELSYTVENQLKEIMSEDENFRPFEYVDLIKSTASKVIHGKVPKELKVREGIKMYKKDYELIDTLDTRQEKRLMFTAIALSRFFDNNGWIYLDINELFSLANIKTKRCNRELLLGALTEKGLLDINMKADSAVNVRVVNYMKENGSDKDVQYTITEFNQIGNQGIVSAAPTKYMICSKCGKLVKKQSNSMKYCKHCAKEMKNIN